jgi:multiple sugar transport system substrate-binding protein
MAPQVFGSTAQWRAGHYALHCNMTSWLWAHGGSVFGPNGTPTINDDRAHEAMEYMLKLGETMPPGVTNWDWHEESRSFARGQAAIYASWGEFFPIYDDPKASDIVGLAETARSPIEKALRPSTECSPSFLSQVITHCKSTIASREALQKRYIRTSLRVGA